MLEFATTFTPDDGSPPRAVTIRISDVRETGASWSAQVEILGLKTETITRVHGVDWLQAIELAARFIALECTDRGGAFNPPLYPRTPMAVTDEESEDEAGPP